MDTDTRMVNKERVVAALAPNTIQPMTHMEWECSLKRKPAPHCGAKY